MCLDLTFIEDGNSDTLPNKSQLINFEKRMMISKVIQKIQLYQKKPYDFMRLGDVQKYLRAMDTQLLTEDQAYQLSLKLEPRTG
jgi:hypothetical protein